MEQLGPGSVLGTRFVASRRVQVHPRWERWSALDSVLGRDVILLCFPATDPHAAATIDAGRRAALVEDPRLVRVLDVVTSGAAYAVVEEPLPHFLSLTRILAEGGLPGDEAHRITGESAAALAAGGARGLHHLGLTPRNVLIGPDGTIKIRGLATESALMGRDDTADAKASRLDARSLVGIGYAALTGRWPLTGADSGLEPSPSVGGRIVTPGELGAGSSPTLDRLARVTLAENRGPVSPDDVVAALHPWPSAPTVDVVNGDVDRFVAQGFSVPVSADSAVVASPVATAGLAGSGEGAGDDEGAPGGAATGVSGAGAGAVAGAGAGAGVGAGAVAGPGAGAVAGAGASAGAGAGAVAGSLASAVAHGARRVGTTLGEASSTAAAAAARLGHRVGERARHTTEQVTDRLEQVGRDRAAGAPSADLLSPRTTADDGAEDTQLSAVLVETDDRRDAPGPLLPEASLEPGPEETKLALAIVAALVVLLAILGLWGLPEIGSPSGSTSRQSTVATATARASTSASGGVSAPTAGGNASAPAGAPAGPAVAAGTPVAVIGTSGFEVGVGQVSSTTSVRAFDGRTDTMWRSGWFSTASFGGLPKQGIGVIGDLGQQTAVRRVVVDVPVAQDLAVYLANRATLEGATTIGQSTGRSGELVFDVPSGPGTSGQLVIVVVTLLGADDAGKFRAQIRDVRVTT